MRIITSLFLRAKAWQLFCVAVILFVSFSISSPDTEVVTRPSAGRLALASLFFGLLGSFITGWLWSVGALLNSIVLPRFRHNHKWFSYAAIVLIAIFVFLPWSGIVGGHVVILEGMAVLFFASFICGYMEQRAVAKAMVSAETGMAPTQWEFMNAFFPIGFWPLGIWSVQPKINRWYEENKNEFMPRKTTAEQR
jgi:hypothetical protein